MVTALGDDFEYVNSAILGTDPLDADSDDDGLSDFVEYRWSTSIDSTDTDNDGLSDDQEVFHQLGDDSWTGGGWFVNAPDGNAYWLFSSPIDSDADLDGLTDASEKAFNTSPFAFDPAPQLTLEATPLSTSPSGNTAVYAAPGQTIRLDLGLENNQAFSCNQYLKPLFAGWINEHSGWHHARVAISGNASQQWLLQLGFLRRQCTAAV